ncbi:MAG: PAS domain-containing sensor histidine kinase [Nitrospirae bacterium]|nr:PAS domain-containing sensor histidine kinase [Nitrospirota bacterium]
MTRKTKINVPATVVSSLGVRLFYILAAVCTFGLFILLYLFYLFSKEQKQRLRYERSLQMIRQQLEGLIESSHAVIYSRRPGSGYPFIYIRENVTVLLGYTSKQFINDPDLWFKKIHPEDQALALSSLNTTDVSVYNLTQYRILHANGDYRWIQDNTKLIFDQSGSPILVLGSWIDVTQYVTSVQALKDSEERFRNLFNEKLKYEKELLKKTEQLDNLNKNLQQKVEDEVIARQTQEQILIHQSRLAAMGEMIAVITHQWKQPLNTLSLLVQDVVEAYSFGEVNQEYVNEFVGEALAQIQFMSSTVNDFKNFFKTSKSKVDFDCMESVMEVVNLLSSQLKAFSIELSCIKDGNPVMLVSGYPNEFKQAVLNILNNSVDAIVQREKGDLPTIIKEITIKAHNEDDRVILAISDTGGGIPAQNMGRLFEPYYTTKKEGTGIGLYMARTIIEGNMGGKIHAENTDKGASFVIELKRVHKNFIH